MYSVSVCSSASHTYFVEFVLPTQVAECSLLTARCCEFDSFCIRLHVHSVILRMPFVNNPSESRGSFACRWWLVQVVPSSLEGSWGRLQHLSECRTSGDRRADFFVIGCVSVTHLKVSLFNSIKLFCSFLDVSLPLVSLRHVQRTKLLGLVPVRFPPRHPPAAPPQWARTPPSLQGRLLELGEAEPKAEGQQMLPRKTVPAAGVSAACDDEEFKERGDAVLACHRELQR